MTPDPLPLPIPLLIAHAPAAARRWHEAVWRYDQALAATLRSARDPMLGAIRIAWWREAVEAPPEAPDSGEPIVRALRALRRSDATASLVAMADGWDALYDADTAEGLLGYASGRGGGLFAALAGRPLDTAEQRAGEGWALWDLAAHSSSDDLADRALALAAERMPERRSLAWEGSDGPLAILTALARPDVAARRRPRAFGWSGYARLWRAALLGR